MFRKVRVKITIMTWEAHASTIRGVTAYYERFFNNYNKPHKLRFINKNNPNIHISLVSAPTIADVMKLEIKVDSETKILRIHTLNFCPWLCHLFIIYYKQMH